MFWILTESFENQLSYRLERQRFQGVLYLQRRILLIHEHNNTSRIVIISGKRHWVDQEPGLFFLADTDFS